MTFGGPEGGFQMGSQAISKASSSRHLTGLRIMFKGQVKDIKNAFKGPLKRQLKGSEVPLKTLELQGPSTAFEGPSKALRF